MNKSKIIIIDPQNDFTSLEGVYAMRHAGISQITKAKTNINKLLARYEANNFVILRSDYKPNQFGEGISMCIPYTFGNQVDSDLHLHHAHTILTKTEHSGFSVSNFSSHLKEAGVTTLFLCGFLAEYCVRQTARDAIEHGYTVYLIEDCIGTGDDVQERKRLMLEELISMGVKVTNSAADFYAL